MGYFVTLAKEKQVVRVYLGILIMLFGYSISFTFLHFYVVI